MHTYIHTYMHIYIYYVILYYVYIYICIFTLFVDMGLENRTLVHHFPFAIQAVHLVRFGTFQSWSLSIGTGAANSVGMVR